MCEISSGWHIGISSEVFFAAAIPAKRATSRGLPLGFCGSFLSTPGRIFTNACAIAVRWSRLFRGDVHHARAALFIVMGELFHLSSTRISSPSAHDSRSGSATRNALARASAGMSPEPCHAEGLDGVHLRSIARAEIASGRACE